MANLSKHKEDNADNMIPAMTRLNTYKVSNTVEVINESDPNKQIKALTINKDKEHNKQSKQIKALIINKDKEHSNKSITNSSIKALRFINKDKEYNKPSEPINAETGTNITPVTNSAISIASNKLKEMVNQNTLTIMPNTSLVATENKELAQDDRDISCVDVAETIAKNFPIRNHNEELFLFESSVYKPLSKHEAIVKIRSIMHTLKMPKVPPQKYNDIYKLLMTSPDINIPKGYIKPNLLACNDFIIDLQTKNIFINDGLEFITSKINANFHSQNLYTPFFDKFLNDASGGDPILIKRMLITIGYCLTQDMAGQYFFLCYGPPHTGKSLFIKIILALISDDAVCQYSINDLSKEFMVIKSDIQDYVTTQTCLKLK